MNFKYTIILINFFLLVFSFKVMSDNQGTKKIETSKNGVFMQSLNPYVI